MRDTRVAARLFAHDCALGVVRFHAPHEPPSPAASLRGRSFSGGSDPAEEMEAVMHDMSAAGFGQTTALRIIEAYNCSVLSIARCMIERCLPTSDEMPFVVKLDEQTLYVARSSHSCELHEDCVHAEINLHARGLKLVSVDERMHVPWQLPGAVVFTFVARCHPDAAVPRFIWQLLPSVSITEPGLQAF